MIVWLQRISGASLLAVSKSLQYNDIHIIQAYELFGAYDVGFTRMNIFTKSSVISYVHEGYEKDTDIYHSPITSDTTRAVIIGRNGIDHVRSDTRKPIPTIVRRMLPVF